MSALHKIRSSPDLENFNIRPRQPADTEALFTLFSQPACRQGMVTEPFRSLEEISAWFALIGTHYDLVATRADQPIGYAGLKPRRGGQRHVGTLSLYVHDAFQRRGIGTLLLATALATADQWLGLDRVELMVFCDNRQAITLYSRFGFEVEGRHRAFATRDSEFVDAFTMARLARGRQAHGRARAYRCRKKKPARTLSALDAPAADLLENCG